MFEEANRARLLAAAEWEKKARALGHKLEGLEVLGVANPANAAKRKRLVAQKVRCEKQAMLLRQRSLL